MINHIIGAFLAVAVAASAHAEDFVALASGTIPQTVAAKQIGPGVQSFSVSFHGIGPTAQAAEQDAIKRCEHAHGKGCVATAVQQGGCFAAALGEFTGGSGLRISMVLGPTEPATLRRALDECSDGGKVKRCGIAKKCCVHD